MNLAFVGFGPVARRFLRLLDGRKSILATTDDLSWKVIGIATARHGLAIDDVGIDPTRALHIAESQDNGGDLRVLHREAPPAPGSPDARPSSTADFLDAVTRLSTEHLVVVENTPLGLDGGEPGVGHVRRALARGASVITANKSPAAFAFRALQDLAVRNQCFFRAEGAVLDGLPVFSLIRNALPGLAVRGFRGIVNTTTNHVLTRMATGQTLDEAVAEMQTVGVAEADPSRDIDGWDAAAKTAVLVNTLMDGHITPHDVKREGLGNIRADDVRRVHGRGQRLKLVASARRENGRLVATARPVILDADDPLANLDGTAKGLEIDTDLLGPLVVTKRESGVDHTAYALLCDLVDISRRRNA